MKFGVLGLGSIGHRHALNLISLGHEVVWYDPWVTKPKLPPGAAKAETEDELLDLVDAVVIASPSDRHLEQLNRCLDAALDGILVEKPLATSRVSVNLPAYPTIVMMGNNLRFHPGVKKAKEWLDKKSIGRPHFASFMVAQHTDKDAYKRDGVILNWGSHEVDLALHLLGPGQVQTCLAHGSPEDLAVFTMHHPENDCVTNFHLDYLTTPSHRACMICGDSGVIIMDLEARVNVMSKPSRANMIEELPGSFNEDYVAEIKAFVDAIEGKPMEGATGEDGARCLEALLEARKIGGLGEDTSCNTGSDGELTPPWEGP